MKAIRELLLGALTISALAACSPASHSNNGADAAAGIIGGTEIEQNNPIRRSVVALYMMNDAGQGGICTGTLIGNNLVLTAAHCITKKMVVVFNVNLDNAQQSDVRQVDAVAVNPAYATRANRPTDNGDIALVHFKGAIAPGYIPAPVLPAARKGILRDNTLTMLVGYGQNNGTAGTGSGVLRAASVRIAKADFAPTEVALDQTHGRGACHGDSGGPAFIFVGGTAFVWGVTSRGEEGCATVGIYTNAAAYEEWIQKTAQLLVRQTGGGN